MTSQSTERLDVLVIGGGQAGLGAGYHLSSRGSRFLIVDANERTGDAWRHRWDSLHLFTPNRFNSLPGLAIEGDDWGFPSKDEVADYLESYAAHFELPIRRGTKVTRLTRDGDRFLAFTRDEVFEADNVIVAMADSQVAKVPGFAADLGPDITQLHAANYKRPDQLAAGDVLVVGLGNSGAEIAMELVRDRRVLLSGEPNGVQPFRPEGTSGRILMPIVGPIILGRILTTSTPMGRKMRTKVLHKGGPLMRVKPKDLVAAGVERVGRVDGVVDGRPRVADGSVLDIANVIWCTGFHPGFSWIDLPIYDENGDVAHNRGVAEDVPGLYFVGLKFQHSVLSDTLLLTGKESGYVVEHMARRARSRQGSLVV